MGTAIVELRSYILQPGKQGIFLDFMATEGMAIERPILGHLLGFYTSEIGQLNRVVHLWRYESFDERAVRRKRLAEAPAWMAFLPKVLPLCGAECTKTWNETAGKTVGITAAIK